MAVGGRCAVQKLQRLLLLVQGSEVGMAVWLYWGESRWVIEGFSGYYTGDKGRKDPPVGPIISREVVPSWQRPTNRSLDETKVR